LLHRVALNDAVVAAMADVSRADIKVLSRAACRRQLRAVLPMNKCPRRPSPLQTVAALVARWWYLRLCWRFLALDHQGSPRKMSVIIWFGDTASYLPHGRRRDATVSVSWPARGVVCAPKHVSDLVDPTGPGSPTHDEVRLRFGTPWQGLQQPASKPEIATPHLTLALAIRPVASLPFQRISSDRRARPRADERDLRRGHSNVRMSSPRYRG
jgi:hypothetical protein